MPTITFEKRALEEYLNAQLSDGELREKITMLGTDIDAFGEEISVEIFPNRPDLLSVPGLARAINDFTNNPAGTKYAATKGEHAVTVDTSVSDVRPHTRCLIARGLELDEQRIEQIIQLQEKLHVTFGRRRKKAAIGIYPLEHITLPIRYEADEPKNIVFTPLEADEEMNAQQLLEQHPTGKKYAHLLEEETRYPVFRDADDNVLSVPPIINSKTVGEITADTTDAFVEVSGHEPRPLEQALNMIACALIDMGASIEAMTVDYGDNKTTCPKLKPQQRTIDTGYVLARSGIPQEALADSLAKMGLVLEGDTVTIPAYRTDFLHDADVIEDALIGYGYDNLQSRIPQTYTVGGLDEDYLREEKIREVLSGLGMQEVMTWALREEGVALTNPLTENYTSLRADLLSNALDVLKKNLSNSYPQRIYEVGPVFKKDAQAETGVSETPSVCGVLCSEEADYTAARQALEALAHALGWDLEFSEHADERFIDGRCAQISGDVSGVIGEVHPRELAGRGVKTPASAFEVQRK